MSNIGRDLLNVPMGEMIREMAFAIADAQYELDQASVHVAQMMGGRMPILDDAGNITGTEDTRVFFGKDEDGNSQKLSMMELGFSPTFYQFTNNIIEVKIAIKMSREIERTKTTNTTKDLTRRKGGVFGAIFGGRTKIGTTTVDATYSSKYNYSAEGASLLRCNLVPIPAPATFEERVRAMIENENPSDDT
ncbi:MULTISPECIES: hypothetical protein [unclassified Neptuniibacter]|uniref:hypothetical protein n=1 Tax=unclassified Neptuniibacter TaxID=2630693 RepID=UPI000C65C6A1|nr:MULTISPECIES: hypothetical protein [unclassified Neptuniibacter]MAY42780.1 hypothetical protein [Oceanospirillaceae bacterium]